MVSTIALMAAPAFEMSASTTRAACAVALSARVERCGGRRARIALRALFALRATRFLGSHESCGAREACRVSMTSASLVLVLLRTLGIICSLMPTKCIAVRPGRHRDTSLSSLHTCSDAAHTATFAGALQSCPQRSRSHPCSDTTQRHAAAAAQMAPPTRRRRPATSFLLALLAQRATTYGAAQRRRRAAPQAYAAGLVVEAAAGLQHPGPHAGQGRPARRLGGGRRRRGGPRSQRRRTVEEAPR